MDLVCLSHSPLMRKLQPRGESGKAFFRTIQGVRGQLFDNRPDVIVIFGPDHFNGFKWDMMPQFCIGLGAESTADWDIDVKKLDVRSSTAEEMVEALHGWDIDVAVSKLMHVDHGFTIPLELLFGGIDTIPIIPIFVNCAAPPRPSCRRSRIFGEAVGRFLGSLNMKILVVGSGGLSHDPPHASFEDLTSEMQEMMLGLRSWDSQHENARQQRIIKVAESLADGGEPCLAPDRMWDAKLLDLFEREALEEVDEFDDDWITRIGGRGGHEIRTWIAAFSALRAAGSRYRSELLFYEVVPEWITGMAIMRAST